MSLSNVIAEIETFVLNEVKSVETSAEKWWQGFEPVLESDLSKFWNAVKPIALDLVIGLAQAAISGPAKMAAVSAALVATAEAQGITASKTMADTVVQQLVASLGAAKPQ